MVELQIVVLVVAGSSPVGHPTRRGASEIPISKSQAPNLAVLRQVGWNLEFEYWDFRPQGGGM